MSCRKQRGRERWWELGLFLLMLVILWNSCRKGKTYFNVTRLDFSEM